MDKKSSLYQLMILRTNGIMNELTTQDGDYQALNQKADKYTDELRSLNLPREVLELFDQCASTYNAIGSRCGEIAYLLGFSDCRELLFGSEPPGKEGLPSELL